MDSYNKAKYFICSVVIFLFISVNSFGQSYNISNYSIESGLPVSLVLDAVQDSIGKMWFATAAGISVYDGFQWHNFNSKDGLSKSGYRKIKVDEKGIIWCIPLNIYDSIAYFRSDTLHFLTPPDIQRSSNSVDINSFSMFYNADKPILCIGTFYGIYYFDGSIWKKYTSNDGLMSDYIYSISEHDKKFYVVSDKGISIFDGTNFDNSLNEISAIKQSQVLALAFENENDKIWVLSQKWIGWIEDKRVNIVNDKFELPYHNELFFPSILPPNNNLVFFGNYFLSYYVNLKTGELFPTTYKHGFVSDGATSIFIDREENIWRTGTRGIDRANNLFLLKYNALDGLQDNEVTAICEINKETLILGHNEGITIFSKNKTVKINLPELKNYSRESGRILDICKGPGETVWLASSSFGLGKLDLKGNLNWIKTPDASSTTSVRVDKSGTVWVVTSSGVFKESNGRLIKSTDLDYKDLYLRRIYISEDDDIYLTSVSEGVFRKTKNDFRQFRAQDNVNANNVYAVYKDSKKRVFIGTKAGLYIIKNNSLEKFNENGLTIDKPVYSIIQDKQNNYWFGTNDGVIKWDGFSRIRSLTRGNGFAGRELNRAAICADSDGDVWFGSESGMTCYRPEYDKNITPVPSVLLLGAEDIAGNRFPLNHPVKLTSNNNSIYFNFRGLSFVNEDLIKYKIKLEGFDADWYEVNQSQINKIRYTNLKSGKYKLLVAAKNISGEWSNVVSSSEITIDKPNYLKWWFILIVLAGFTIIIYMTYRIYMKRIYYSKLELKVLERTSELKETEKALRNSQAELEEKVIERTKELATANEKLKELNTSKDKFFSIIAHDMKSSFTGLFGYSEVLKNGAQTMSKQAIVDCSEKLYKNVNNSFNLLENLLNWALLQTGRMTCNPEKIEFNQDMSNILELFEENAKIKNIILQNDIKDDLILKADRNMLRTMIHNLVSNAIKFTNSGGKVIISSKISNGFTEISVSDNGVGIPKEYITRLFSLDSNITTKGTAKEKGTGLGLLLCKEMMDMHKGKINVESESGFGTTFKLILPN